MTHFLSWIIGLLSVVVSLGGLLQDGGIYRDNELVKAGWYGNDLVTLFVAAPLLFVSLIFSRTGSQRGSLLLIGMLAYTLYNFFFYLFGAAFNELFLVYLILVVLSVFGLISSLSSLDKRAISARVSLKLPTTAIAGFMLFTSGFFGVFWSYMSIDLIFSGRLPPIINATGQSTNIVAALDGTMVVPFGLLGAIWLWKRHEWGYLLALIWNVKGAVYTLALTAATLSSVHRGASDQLEQVFLWVFITLGCTLSAGALLLAFSESQDSQ